MVGVAQLVEHLVVVQGVGGSSPLTHPMCRADTELCFGAPATSCDVLPTVSRRPSVLK
jgi:hypothetical protein